MGLKLLSVSIGFLFGSCGLMWILIDNYFCYMFIHSLKSLSC